MFSHHKFVKFCLLIVLFAGICTKVNGQTGEIDVCKSNPCANKGICVQTNVSPFYKCQCYGTGFYGTRCKYSCPKDHAPPSRRSGPIPTECIVI